MRAFSLFVLTVSAFLSAIPDVFAVEKNVTIGTGGVTGVYYPAGGAICRMVNRGRKEHGIRCAVESTGGSIANLEAINNKDIEFGIAQSDLLYYAYNGKEIFSDAGKDRKIRALLSLHYEPFTIVARNDAKIDIFDDLKGKRIYIGPLGSGMRATMEELIAEKGLDKKRFAKFVDIKAEDQTEALCGGKIDALIYAGGHPNGAIQQVTSSCATKIVGIAKKDIEKLVASHPFYVKAVIPAGMYSSNSKDVNTFGVRALLVTSEDTDEDVVYQIVKAVFDNLDNFKTLHPVFMTLDAKHMVANDNVVPLHAGAERYYNEKGLLNR